MKKIYILEHFDFSDDQMKRLKQLGDVKYFDKANQQQIDDAVKNADAVLLDWIDPNPILAKMRKGQFICLPYTGYDWVSNIQLAKDNGVVLSNTPNYSTNAVAEHHLSLILACAKHVCYFNNIYKSGKQVPFNRGKEISKLKVGIIGLGHIGTRLSELLSGFGVEIMTYNNHARNLKGIKDVDLNTLLKESDIVCNTCRLTPQTRNMLSKNEFELMKNGAILTSTTGGIVNLDDLAEYVDKFFGIGLDDVDQQKVPEKLKQSEKVVCTYHRAFDTNESERNRINLCIDNIEAFFKGKPINMI